MPYVTINQGISNGSGGGSGGDVTLELNAATQQQQWAAVGAGSVNIPAGAYTVRVWNTGLENITVNGAPVPPGEEWRVDVQYNFVTSRQDFCPVVDIIVPTDGQASYQVLQPSL